MQVFFTILAVVVIGWFSIGFLTNPEGLEGLSEDQKTSEMMVRLLLLVCTGLLIALLFHMNN
ncbi:hypothetical protein [Gelria sp. Kuro-4]|uniref:hypothetical protein n=1 Tax=Gelria sp. Kuro-4 TaxID=2796927 RepID=UPI001BF027E9|nr:hypothetical protein [Gelria sp. Kuro-4]BCV23304.1 hypothetical protein kuro4_00770 [Gelria sp. Kuro-4]